MAISTTTFLDRLGKINAGKTTAWTVPGEGLATIRDERSFLRKTGWKVAKKSTHSSFNPVLAIAALMSGAVSVIVARWLDFTFLDDAMAFATEQGINAAAIVESVPTALALAFVLSVVAMLVLGLKSKMLYVQISGFVAALLFEADLVALAPEIYSKFYPPTWVADMMASATLLT